MSIQPNTVKLFETWTSAPVYYNLLTGPDALVLALDEAVDGNRIHDGAATYTGNLHVTQNRLMIQGVGTVSDIVDGCIDIAPGCTGDWFDQLQVLGTVDVRGSIGTTLNKNIFHADVTIADDSLVTRCSFRDGARLVTPADGTFDFASGRAQHSVAMLLGLLDGYEHITVTGWSAADHLDLSETDLSVVGVTYDRRWTHFTLSDGDTIDIQSRHAVL